MDKKQVIILASVTILFWSGLYTFVPTLTPYAKGLGANVTMLGLIGGSYGLMQMVFRIPIGILSDRTKKRKPFLLAGMAFVLISSVSFTFSSDPGGLLISRSLSGIAASFLSIITVMLSSYFVNTTKGIGIVNACLFSGLMAATVAGGWASQNFGPKVPFIISIVLASIGLLISLLIKEKKIERKPLKMRELLEIGKDKVVIFYSILGIALQFITYGTTYVFTPLVAKELGADDTVLGLLTFIYTLPGIIASLLVGTSLFKKMGYKNILGFAFILMGGSCIPIVLTKSLLIVYIAQFISGFGRGIGFALLLSLIVDNVSDDKKATAASFHQAIYALGMFSGPIFTGLTSRNSSFFIPYSVISIICLIAAVCAFVYSPINQSGKKMRLNGSIM